MRNLFLAFIGSYFLRHISALSTNLTDVRSPNTQRRNVDTCGDPSVAMTFYEAFNTRVNAHACELQPTFVNANTGGDFWSIDSPIFRAWLNPGQPSTVPFYRLVNPTTSDYVYVTSTTGNPPSRSGFVNQGIANYVYTTQICNSVPLYAAFQPADHWYTTNLAEHDYIVDVLGWSDSGIIAYVLPIDDFSEIVA